MQPFFSILIPVYNQVGLMDKCMASLRAQTFTDFEVIFVNDGSTDSSPDMLSGFCGEDSRFSVYTHEKNSSLLAARYTGMQHARGQYVLFVDSDDSITDDACEKLHDALLRQPVDLLRFGYTEEPAGNVMMPTEINCDPVYAVLHNRITPTVWKNCYSRKLIERAMERTEPFYCNMSEDVFWGTVFFSCADTIDVLNEVLYHYEVGNGMSTTSSNVPLARQMKHYNSILTMAEHYYTYIGKWCPQYMDDAHHKIEQSLRFILAMSLLNEQDLAHVMDHIYLLRDDERLNFLYESACR